MPKDGKLVFNRKTGVLGIVKFVGNEPESHGAPEGWNSNFAVILLDPMTLHAIHPKVWMPMQDWIELPDTDKRVQAKKILDAIYDADWTINAHCCNSNCDGYDTEVDESFMTNEAEVLATIFRAVEAR